MRNPDFKDVLQEMIEKNGGLNRDNLLRLSDKIRRFKPEFSAAYLQRLLSGHPPSREDREAISQVMEPAAEKWMSMYWGVEEVGHRRFARIASRHTKSPVIAKELVEGLLDEVNYRNMALPDHDVEKILKDLISMKELEDEFKLFQYFGIAMGIASTSDEVLLQVIERFELGSIPVPVDLHELASRLGVSSIKEDSISSEAMLVPTADGYKIILKKATSYGELTRQRFSFAHELGHLLLKSVDYNDRSVTKAEHREKNKHSEEERLCDQIAAEILMPRAIFAADATEASWSLGRLGQLAKAYGTSIPATARRMVGLMPGEPCVMGIWKPASANNERHGLQQSYGPQSRYRVPNSSRLSRRRLWLIARAANSRGVESGIAPLLDQNRPSAFLPDVPADAWAWGKEEYRRVLVFYYPERELTDDMTAVASSTWRLR